MSSSSPVGTASARSVAAGIDRSLTAGSTLRAHASCICSSETSGGGGGVGRRPASATGAGPAAGAGTGEGPHDSAAGAPACRRDSSTSTRWTSDSRARSACGPGHLDERQLERKPRIAALPLVLEDDGQQVDQPQDGGLGKLVRLLAQPVARLLGERQRVGHVAEVLHEQQVAQVLEQVPRQLAEVLAALGQLLDEHERARDVAVDDRVAEPEQHVLLDRRAELEHVLHRDRLARRGGELVERRDRVAERAPPRRAR